MDVFVQSMLRVIKSYDTQTGELISRKEDVIEDVLTDEGYRVPPHKLGEKIFADVPFPEDWIRYCHHG